MSENPHTILIALGANATSPVGGPADTLTAAVADLRARGLEVERVSRFWRSPAWPPGSGPDFVNAALVARGEPAQEGVRARRDVEDVFAPEAVLALLHEIEAGFGRVRMRRWGPRTLDLDLLAVGPLILPDAQTLGHWIGLDPARQQSEAPSRLILPHPRMQDRAFVLAPLSEVAPGWRHPLLGLDVAGMLARLPSQARDGLKPL